MAPILVGKSATTPTGAQVVLLPQYGNRHGLVAGATGTGKTVTLMTLASWAVSLAAGADRAMRPDFSGKAFAGTFKGALPLTVCSPSPRRMRWTCSAAMARPPPDRGSS